MGRLRRCAGWSAAHPIDVAFGLVVAAAFAHLVWVTANGWFFLDDWGLLDQSGSLAGIFRPYNDHLSIAILGSYRALAEAVGFEYGPYRVVGLLCLLAIPVLFHVTTRRFLGAPVSAVLALSTIAYANLELRPSSLNHYVVVVGAIGCAAALNRGPRADGILGASLALALCGAGGGSAVAVACLVHNACTRPHRRRWVVVLTPFLLWVGWYLTVARTDARPVERQALTDAIATGARLAWTPFQHVGLQQPVLSIAALAAFVLFGVGRVRQGPARAANFLAWVAGLGAWCGGVGLVRVPDALENGFWQLGPIVFRYQVVTLAFVLLALVPRSPVRWPEHLRAGATPAAAVGLLLVAALAATSLRGPIGERADAYERKGWEMRSVVLELRADNLNRFPLPGLAFFDLQAHEVLALLDRYGAPEEGPLPLPVPPTIGTATAGDGRATVSWTAPADDGGSPLVGYVITPYSGFTPHPPQRFSSTTTTQTVTGLDNGVTYRFKVQAENETGLSGYSDATDPVTPGRIPN